MTWDEFKPLLLDLMGKRLVVDVQPADSPYPIVGFEGLAVNTNETLLDGDPDKLVGLGLRIRSEGSSAEATRVDSYFNVLEAEFRNAGWEETADGEPLLRVELRLVTALIQVEE